MAFWKKKKTSPTDIDSPRSDLSAKTLPTLAEEHEIWDRPGPRNSTEVDYSTGYVDMGALQLPIVPGMQVQTQMAPDGTTIIRTLVVLGNSGLQISLAAAPRSGGVWDELRDSITKAMREEGSEIQERSGRYGQELIVSRVAQAPDGGTATSHMRVLGIDGERWFSRIDVIGPAAHDETLGREIEKIIDRIVIVRDQQPRARLDLLPVRAPQGAAETA